MSFAYEIKQEILAKDFAVDNARAFLSGLVTTAGVPQGSKTIVKLNNFEFSQVIRDMATQLGLQTSHSNENRNFIVLDNFKILRDIKLPAFFFAGAFVGGGSISDIDSKSYHLEIQVHLHANALFMQKFLNRYFAFTLIQRRLQWVLYIKKAEMISDFLRAVEAFNNMMKFEDARITRDFKNNFNRHTNLDTYNQLKLVLANNRFKKWYKFIKDRHLTHLFTKMELSFYDLKVEHDLESLEQLTQLINEKYSIKKTRAGLNHWLIKLRQIYEQHHP